MKRIAFLLAIAAGLSIMTGSALAKEPALTNTLATVATTASDAAKIVPVGGYVYQPYTTWYAPGYYGSYYYYDPYVYHSYPYYYSAPYGGYHHYYYPHGTGFRYSGPRISFGFGF